MNLKRWQDWKANKQNSKVKMQFQGKVYKLRKNKSKRNERQLNILNIIAKANKGQCQRMRCGPTVLMGWQVALELPGGRRRVVGP